MILIGVAWLLILAIALYQSMHGLFSAVIMAFLTTVCAVVALGSYEWLGQAFLYSTQPAYADALSLIIHFVIPLLVLRILFDKLIIGNAALGGFADRFTGGILGLYIGTVMVGILTIAMQMIPYGASVLGYKPFDSSLQRISRIYCDEFALGVFGTTAGLATDRSFTRAHDDLLLELFCGRNTAGRNGRVDTLTSAIIPTANMPADDWKKVVDSDKLPEDPFRPGGKSKVLIVRTQVPNTTRNADPKDGWYRLPATHFRLVTESGASLYPLGYIDEIENTNKWQLHPAATAGGKAQVADLCVLRRFMGEKIQEICWVYRVPIPDTGEANFENTRETDPSQADLPKEERANMYSPKYLVFRRTARTAVPAITHKLLPLTSKGIAEAKAKADAAKKAKADAEAAKKKART